MKFAPLSIACLAALAVTSAANAAVVMYPAADTSVTRVNNATDQTVESSVSFAAADRFVDGQSGTPDVSRTRYYGGIYSYVPTNSTQWGGGFSLRFNMTNPAVVAFVFGKPAGRSELFVDAPSTNGGQSNNVGAYTGTEVDLPFVLKFEDDNWNLATVRIFIGGNATALTEGTPDKTFTGLFSDITVTGLTTRFEYASWAQDTSTGSLSGFFASDAWNPVVIPEPTTLAALGMLGCGLMARRNRTK